VLHHCVEQRGLAIPDPRDRPLKRRLQSARQPITPVQRPPLPSVDIGTILGDPFDRGIGEHLRLPLLCRGGVKPPASRARWL
jgi:hypothetical protein